jgi:hypothetical protein
MASIRDLRQPIQDSDPGRTRSPSIETTRSSSIVGWYAVESVETLCRALAEALAAKPLNNRVSDRLQ